MKILVHFLFLVSIIILSACSMATRLPPTPFVPNTGGSNQTAISPTPTSTQAIATKLAKRVRVNRTQSAGSVLTPGAIATSAPSSSATVAVPAQKIKIMSLGGSVAFGWPDLSYGGFQHLLGTLLTNDGYNFDFVGSQQNGVGVIPYPNNEGHPGWTIMQIKNGIDSKGWLETYQPDIILLYIGSNDISQGDVASAPANLSALLDDILKRLPQTHIIVAQLISPKSGPDQGRLAYNAAIPGIVASKGAQLSIADMQNILSSSDYAPDGMHPNSGGYDKLARIWEPAIRAIIDK